MLSPNHKSIKFTYLYRDASNYKSWGEIIFSNPEEFALKDVDTQLRKSFDVDGIFTADQVGVPEVFLYSDGNVTADDHCFHEFYSVEASNDESTDVHKRSIKSFVEQVEGESQHGWRVFDPSTRHLLGGNRF